MLFLPLLRSPPSLQVYFSIHYNTSDQLIPHCSLYLSHWLFTTVYDSYASSSTTSHRGRRSESQVGMVPLKVVVGGLSRHLHFVFWAFAIVTLHAALIVIGVTVVMETRLGVVLVIEDLKGKQQNEECGGGDVVVVAFSSLARILGECLLTWKLRQPQSKKMSLWNVTSEVRTTALTVLQPTVPLLHLHTLTYTKHTHTHSLSLKHPQPHTHT